MRRLPLADQRLRRHAEHRHRRGQQRHRRSAPRRRAQPAPVADGRQHGVLAGADVERPFQRAVARSVRQLEGLPVSGARRGDARSRPTIRSCSTCCRRRPTFRRPSSSRWRGSRARAAPSGRASISSTTARVCACRRPTGPGSATSRSARRCSKILNDIPKYRKLFGDLFPSVRRGGDRSTSTMFGLAIAEFEFTLTFADAPIDRFARGHRSAMSTSEKRGALLFFGKAGCVKCHAVSGDVERDVQRLPEPRDRRAADRALLRRRREQHDLRRPWGRRGFRPRADQRQLRPTATSSARRRCATSRCRRRSSTTARSPGWTTPSGIISTCSIRPAATTPREAGVDRDLRMRLGPIEPVLARLDPLLRKPTNLTRQEFAGSGRVRRRRVAGQTSEEREPVQAGARLRAERPARAEVPGVSIAFRRRSERLARTNCALRVVN